jgi:hypothetical protein
MTHQKSPTIHREAIGTEIPKRLLPQEKEGPSDVVAATRIPNTTSKDPPRNVPRILSTISTTPMTRIALRILRKVARNMARFLLGQKRSVRSSNRTLLTIRSTLRVAEHVIVDHRIIRNRLPRPTGRALGFKHFDAPGPVHLLLSALARVPSVVTLDPLRTMSMALC